MKKFYNRTYVFMAAACFLSSCSVFMAANKEGVTLEDLAPCKTRTCLLAKGAVPVSSLKNKDGTVAEEIYQVKKQQGSATRAVMHGLLDVASLGIWEVAGTPIEGSMKSGNTAAIKVSYKKNGEDIERFQLSQ